MSDHILQGTGVHYSVVGNPEGETITLLHPAFASGGAFAEQVDYLKSDYLVIVVDMPGHGQSQGAQVKVGLDDTAQCVKQILEWHDRAATHLVGVSMGSLIDQDFANRFPDSTLSLCAVGGYDINNYDQKIAAKQGLQQIRFLTQAMVSIRWFARTNARLSTHVPAATQKFAAMNRAFQRRSLRHFQSVAQIMNQYPTAQRPYPLAIVVGEYDTPLAHELSAQWHQREPRGQFHIIHGAGHCANMDAPQKFNRFLTQFLDSAKSSGS